MEKTKGKGKKVNEVLKVFWWFIILLWAGLFEMGQLSLVVQIFKDPLITKLMVLGYYMGLTTAVLLFLVARLLPE